MTVTPLAAPEAPAEDGAARRWLVENGLPTTRDEAWRYAPLAALAGVVDDPGDAIEARPVAVDRLAGWLDELPDGWRVVLVDGRYDPELSRLGPGGPVVEAEAPTSGAAPVPRDGFEALNRLWSRHPVRVRLDADGGGEDGAVVHLVHLGTGWTSHPRVEVEVAAGRQAVLVETFRSLSEEGLTNATTAVDAAVGSRVDHLVVLPREGGRAHVVRTDLVAHEGSEVSAGVVALGAGAGHHHLTVTLDGPGAEAALTGLTVPGPGGHHDTTASVRHRASHGTSRQHFAAIVPDRGRASFTGHVVVAAGTVGTDADQQDRNLLLGPTARADTRPWLEIHSDQVACTHGATVGRLDTDGVFYLRSRGLTEAAARTMLVRAFATTTVEGLTAPPAVREWVAAAVATTLDGLLAPGPAPDAAKGEGS